MRTPYFFILTIVLILPAIFYWLAEDRIAEHVETHQKIAENSTNLLSKAITRFVVERKRLVSEFAKVFEQQIALLIKNPEDEELIESLNLKLKNIFPNFIAFTLADNQGDMLIDDFDGLIGDLCQRDLANFCSTGRQLPRVHPNTDQYHFDIMVNTKDQKNVLFVSFDANLLSTILNTTDIPGHDFLLTFKIDDRFLIEVTRNGSRQIIKDRLDYRLDEGETQRILHAEDVEKTTWQVIDMHKINWFSDYQKNIYKNFTVIYLIFLVIISVMTFIIRREEKLKKIAEQQRYEFIGVVSHELRTPLTSIKGSLGLVGAGVTGELPDKATEMIKMAGANCDRLIELVNDLLDIQKIEAGKIELNRKNINVSTLVKQAITDIEAYGSKFSVNYQLSDLFPDTIIYADEGRMLQVMNNLLSNAAKYGKEDDSVDVTIISYRNKVRIGISDNGKGISVELQNNIFEKFSQGKSTNNKKISSTGLGLHIVKKIVNLHDGEIDFFTSDTGTTFFVDLPISQSDTSGTGDVKISKDKNQS